MSKPGFKLNGERISCHYSIENGNNKEGFVSIIWNEISIQNSKLETQWSILPFTNVKRISYIKTWTVYNLFCSTQIALFIWNSSTVIGKLHGWLEKMKRL